MSDNTVFRELAAQAVVMSFIRNNQRDDHRSEVTWMASKVAVVGVAAHCAVSDSVGAVVVNDYLSVLILSPSVANHT